MTAVSYSHIGGRTNNQDYYYPQEGGVSMLYIICDGAGGKPYGEVASKLCCGAIAEYIAQHTVAEMTEEYIDALYSHVKKEFVDTETKYPEMKGMATTIVLVAMDGAGAVVAWMGDSRLYHISNGAVKYVTQDHSLVSELTQAGKIKKAQVAGIKNIITRAMSAGSEQPLAWHRIKKGEMSKGDYICMCTDGVLENVNDALLLEILAANDTLAEKRDRLIDTCMGKTKDNFTFTLIEL